MKVGFVGAGRVGQGLSLALSRAGYEITGVAGRDAQVGGFHPLQMFADPEVAARGLKGCAIAVEAEEPLAGTLLHMVADLGARPLRVPPGARGDALTLARHLDALGTLDPSLKDFYRRLALRTLPLALAAGKLDPACAARVRELLEDG